MHRIEPVRTTLGGLKAAGCIGFSIANDVAKYFTIIPAAFVGAFPQLSSPSALVIIFLIPLTCCLRLPRRPTWTP
jgi:high-affinity K+ transport system ATPase subunit B